MAAETSKVIVSQSGGAQPRKEPEAEGAPAEATAAAQPAKPKPVRTIALAVLLAGAAGTAAWYRAHAGLEDTDDAQVDADVVAVPSRAAGPVLRVLFAENQLVKEGDLLVEIDPAPAAAKLAEAEAELLSAQAGADAAEADVQVVAASSKGQKSVAVASLQGAAVAAAATQDEIAQADAQVQAATVAAQQAHVDFDRAKSLFDSNAVPKAQVDALKSALSAAEANLAQAKAHQSVVRSSTAQARARIAEAQARVGETSAVDAQIAQSRARSQTAAARVKTAEAARDLAKLELSYTKIFAPASGLASKKAVIAGQMVGIGQPIVMIVPTSGVWITANFKETQLTHMKLGQPAEIAIDAFPGTTLHGTVESFSGATGARFSLLPPENATGNFTKVVQRVPVRIKLEASSHIPGNGAEAGTFGPGTLRPGMSADVSVDTRK